MQGMRGKCKGGRDREMSKKEEVRVRWKEEEEAGEWGGVPDTE